MARVTAKDREKVAARTGDSSFPMETAAQIRSAIRLRGRGKSKGKAEVLRLASAAVGRLLRSGKINESTAAGLRREIARARERDNMKAHNIEYELPTEELPTEYVNTTPGEPIRLFRFGPLFKGGKMRELTRELLSKFKLPHYKPPIKLGAHDDDAPAGGHITGLEIRDDGLYGLTEYTPQGIQAIEAGNYRYHSPEVIWDGALENPDTGDTIAGPLIVGTALLHTPHLGESAALYGIEPQYNGGDSMTTETVSVPASFLDRLMARFDSGQEPEPEPEPAPISGVEVDQFEALQAERDEMAAQIAKMEAEKAQAARVSHFAAEFKDTVLDEDEEVHELLAGIGDEATAEALLTKFKALSGQIVESNLTGDVGSAGDPDENPHDALNAAIQAKIVEDKVSYQDAFAALRDERPELFAHLKGGAR